MRRASLQSATLQPVLQISARKPGVSKTIGRSAQGRLPTLAGGVCCHWSPPRPMVRNKGEERGASAGSVRCAPLFLRLARNTRLLSNSPLPWKPRRSRQKLLRMEEQRPRVKGKPNRRAWKRLQQYELICFTRGNEVFFFFFNIYLLKRISRGIHLNTPCCRIQCCDLKKYSDWPDLSCACSVRLFITIE